MIEAVPSIGRGRKGDRETEKQMDRRNTALFSLSMNMTPGQNQQLYTNNNNNGTAGYGVGPRGGGGYYQSVITEN